jgi:hypothetical protein
VGQVGIKYCRCTVVAQRMYNIEFVSAMFSAGHRLYLCWARWIQPISRIACQYISVSLWNRNLTLENLFWAVFKKGNLYFVTHCMCSATCSAMCHQPINQTFLSFLWVWNVTSYIEGIMCFEELWGKTLTYSESL